MATIGQTTVSGGRSQGFYGTLAVCRQETMPVAGTVNFVGVWCWESAAANNNDIQAAIYDADGTLLYVSDPVSAPVTSVGTPELVQVPFPPGTTLPAGDVVFAVMSNHADGESTGNLVASGQNGPGGVPVWIADSSSMWDNWPEDFTGMVDTGLARAWDMYLDYTEGSPEPDPATKLAVINQPGNTVVGQTMSAFVLAALNDDDEIDDSFTGNITVTVQSGNGTLSGTTTRAASSGLCSFFDLSIDALNAALVLRASSSGLASADTDAFAVTAGGGGAGGGSLVGSLLVS